LLIGASLEAALFAADGHGWHAPKWTTVPGLDLGFKIADQLHLHNLRLFGVVALGVGFLIQGFLFSLPMYLLFTCASRILPSRGHCYRVAVQWGG
jgi:hypothetical protein